jgi:hypothetical protein
MGEVATFFPERRKVQLNQTVSGLCKKASTRWSVLIPRNRDPETVAIKQEAVPDAAIPDCTHHFFLVKMLREAEFNSTRVVEALQLCGGGFQIQTGEIVLELRYLPRSDDRDYWHRSVAQPGECDLRRAATGLFGDRLHRRYDRRRALFPGKKLLHPLIRHPLAVGPALTVILPG